MGWFKRLSLKRKITVVILAASCVVLLFSSTIFIGAQIATYKRQAIAELETIADILAANVTAAVIFEDPVSARETLSALRAKPGITQARIYSADGRLFAQFPSGPSDAAAAPPQLPRPSARGNEALRLFDEQLELTAPIRLDGEVVGTILLRSDLSHISTIIDTYLMMAGIVVLLLILASILIAARLQKVISAPILDLLQTMQRVAGEQNYGVRARNYGHDELGELATGFNRMLERIQRHDERLNRACREAEAASRAKTEFLANMSHELRTPLNAVIGFSEIIKAELLGPLGNERYRVYAQDIHDSGHHLLEVINDILDISKVEAGEFELQEQSGDLRNIVTGALRLVRERAEAAGITLEVTAEPGVPELWIDRRLIKQSVINLLSNAVKFSPEPGTVTVHLARAADGGIRLSVADRGIGIAEANIARVLQPFAQVESAYARSHEGTGLGLPLAKSFIEAHGGRLEIASRLGEGTTVTLCFPPERVIERGERTRARPAE